MVKKVIILLVISLFVLIDLICYVCIDKRVSSIEKVMPTGKYANQTLETICYAKEIEKYFDSKINSLNNKGDTEFPVSMFRLRRLYCPDDDEEFRENLREYELFFKGKKWEAKEIEYKKIININEEIIGWEYLIKDLKSGNIVTIMSLKLITKWGKVKIKPYIYYSKCNDCHGNSKSGLCCGNTIAYILCNLE